MDEPVSSLNTKKKTRKSKHLEGNGRHKENRMEQFCAWGDILQIIILQGARKAHYINSIK